MLTVLTSGRYQCVELFIWPYGFIQKLFKLDELELSECSLTQKDVCGMTEINADWNVMR